MPKPIEGYVEPLRRSRRAASRAVDRIRSGELGPEEVDFCDLLFGQVKPEAKLAELGLLDDGGLCDEMVGVMAARMRLMFDRHARHFELAEHLEAALLKVQAQNDREPPVKVGPVKDAARNERNNERVSARAASLLAMHLCQRAMYEALGNVLRDMVADQSDWSRDRNLAVGLVHAPMRMGDKHVEAADAAIEKLRRPHMAGRRRREPLDPAVLAESLRSMPEAGSSPRLEAAE